MSQFQPPFGLRHAHIQTIAGSSLRKLLVPRRAATVTAAEQLEVLTTSEGVRLAAWVSAQEAPAPTVVIIHGWLGTHNSSYSLSLAETLWRAGFTVIRLNLRDHGGTAHFNQGMFHNGLLAEVVDVVGQLQARYPTLGLAGFSLGGNFALRLAKQLGIPALGICPLMDPAASIKAVDNGSVVYRRYFMRKWLRALVEKSQAFPGIYDFTVRGAASLTSVHDMTAHFVEQHTDYASLAEYYGCYTLTGDFLAGTKAAILAAADDPVVPVEGFARLPATLAVNVQDRGGHCAFLDSYRLSSFVDGHALDYFESALASSP